MPEAPTSLIETASSVGIFLAIVVVFFVKTYHDARREARSAIDRSPDIAAGAVGAAFVDRTTSHAILEIAADTREIRDRMRDQAEREHDDRLKREIIDDLKNEMGLSGHPTERSKV